MVVVLARVVSVLAASSPAIDLPRNADAVSSTRSSRTSVLSAIVASSAATLRAIAELA